MTDGNTFGLIAAILAGALVVVAVTTMLSSKYGIHRKIPMKRSRL